MGGGETQHEAGREGHESCRPRARRKSPEEGGRQEEEVTLPQRHWTGVEGRASGIFQPLSFRG